MGQSQMGSLPESPAMGTELLQSVCCNWPPCPSDPHQIKCYFQETKNLHEIVASILLFSDSSLSSCFMFSLLFSIPHLAAACYFVLEMLLLQLTWTSEANRRSSHTSLGAALESFLQLDGSQQTYSSQLSDLRGASTRRKGERGSKDKEEKKGRVREVRKRRKEGRKTRKRKKRNK